MRKRIISIFSVLALLIATFAITATISLSATALKITKQPVAASALDGKTVKVSVTAVGDGLKYTWYYKDSGASKYVKDSKNTGTSYSVKMSSKVNGRAVYVVVADKHGAKVKSKAVKLTLGKAAKIKTQPASVSALNGKTAKITVKATGDGLKYTWYYKNSGASKYVKDTKNTTATYSVKMSSKVNGRKVYVVVTDKYGTSVKSNAAKLTLGKAAKITTQPASVSVLNGKTAKITVKATGDGLKYTWYYKDSGASKYVKDTKNTSATYSIKMSSKVNGRKVYVVVSDKYGTSVKSNAVKLTLGKAAKITTQPSNKKVNCGSTAKVTVKATGDGLKYIWYYKDSGASKYVKDTKNTAATYALKMTSKVNGRKIYVVVSDKYGTSVKSQVAELSMSHVYDSGKVTLAATCTTDGVKTYTCKYCTATKTAKISKIGHSYDSGKITKDPTCSKAGVKTYTCANCSGTKTASVAALGHVMGEWETYIEATVTETGVDRQRCTRTGCTYYKDRVSEKLPVKWNITVSNGVDETYTVGVAENGKYVITEPVRIGYNFDGWKTSEGEAFAASGVYKSDVTIVAGWTLDGTDTFEELKERTDAFVSEIKITADITVTEPVFISSYTKLYSDGNFSIIRAADYDGDIFVVGRAKNGKTALELGTTRAVLDLGNGEGMLILDGNKDNVTVDVIGSMIFAADSSLVNMYDGAKIINNRKIGNDRINSYVETNGSSNYLNAGGAAVINLDSEFNMYGGEISGHSVAMETTVVTDPETQTSSTYYYNGCGGAVYTCGTFNMYGGKVSGNEALRGGAFYNNKVLKIAAGELSDNYSVTNGGAVTSSGGSQTDMFFGNTDEGKILTVKNNRSLKAGGALYSTISSPIIIYGNTEFIGNHTDSSGGAIYTSGGLLIEDTLFDGNSCASSGGAIYHQYSSSTYDRRHFEVSGSVFTNNRGNLGGAIILSASDAAVAAGSGTLATITDCTFSKNRAENQAGTAGNGGALYISRKADATVTGCDFTENSAFVNAGAIAMHSESNVVVKDALIQDNTAGVGGAMYISSGAVADLQNLELRNNSAKFYTVNEKTSGGNGGALYVFDSGVLKIDNVDFYGNSADNNAGAVYLGVTEMTIDSTCDFDGNTAGGHGGAFYLTYKTENTTNDMGEVVSEKFGAKLNAKDVTFQNNTAKAGGAISARTATEVNLTNCILKKNTATSGEDTEGGGAIFANDNTVNLSGVQIIENTTAYYGGAITSLRADVTIKDNSVISGNSGKTGAALNFRGTGENNLTDVVIENNGNGSGNGVIYGTEGAVINLTRVNASGNSSTNGSVVYVSSKSTKVNIDGCEFSGNSVKGNGGAICVKGSTLNINNTVITGNSAKYGGAIYSEKGTVIISGSTLSENIATTNGGAVLSDEGDVEITDSLISKNKAGLGGAVYTEKGTLDIDDTDFTENTATINGGAIDIIGTVAVISDDTTFTSNSAALHGGAIYVNYIKKVAATETTEEIPAVYSNITINGCSFTDNTAVHAGAAVSVRTGSVVTFNGTEFDKNIVTGNDGETNGNADGGGAIYVGYGTVNLNNVTATDNEVLSSVYVNDKQEEKLYGYGGFINGYHGEINLVGGTISGSKAPSGGAINLAGSDNTLTVDGTAFIGNTSTYNNRKDYDNSIGGGAINATSAAVTIRNANFDSNSTDWYGGAITFADVIATIEKTTITKSAGSTGAGICIKSGSVVSISDSDISGNVSTGNSIIYANSSTVALNNVTANNNSASKGGVLYISGSKTVAESTGCTFTGNSARGNGGVVFAESATARFIDCTITGNSAKTNGGVAYANNSKAKIEFNGGTISSNTANAGGVVYAEENASVVINGGEFSENSASNGGALFVKNATEFTVDGASFLNNTASENGGAIYVYNNIMTLKNSTFEENSAQDNGGAINNVGTAITATGNNIFVSNAAIKHGGAIYLTYIKAVEATETTPAVEAIRGSIDMTGGSFTGNTAIAGGALSIRTGCSATLKDTVFTNNTVEGYQLVDSNNEAGSNDGNGEGGGAIYVGFGSLTLENVTATGNQAKGTSVIDGEKETVYGFGGAINSYSSTVSIIGGTYENNKAPIGGAISANNGDTVTISGALFLNNESTDSNSGKSINVGGGAVRIYNGTLNISSTTFDGSKSGYYGGAILAGKTNVTINNNSVIKRSQSTTGGFIYLSGSSVLTVENSEFSSNKSTTGGIYTASGSVTLKNITGKDNTAGQGAVLYSKNVNGVVVEDSSFSGNHTTGNGGAFGLYGGSMSIVDCEFTLNSSDAHGGAISMSSGTTTVTGDTKFIENSSGNHGGAVYVSYTENSDDTKNPGIFNMTGGSFVDNSSGGAGGAISARTSCEIHLDSTSFSSNSTEGTAFSGTGGGVIYTNNGAFTLTDVTVDGSSSAAYGGAMSIAASTGTITNSTFTSNTAGHSGGVLYVRGSCTVTVNNSIFRNNQATATFEYADKISRGGGAIHVEEKATVNVTGGSFVSNAALGTTDVTSSGSEMTDAGGAIIVDGGTLNVSGAAFTSNTANNGAAIGTSRSKKTKMNISGCTFTSNHSTQNGGGIYIQNGVKNEVDDIIITDCTFVKNVAEKASGASIYVRTNSSAKIINISCSEGSWSYRGEVYATGGARLTLEGSVSLTASETEKISEAFVITGSSTTAIVNYKTDAEKTAWENAINPINKATVSYNQI